MNRWDTYLEALVLALIFVLEVFGMFPGLDLWISGLFHGASGFIGGAFLDRLGRDFFRVTPYTLLILALLAWVARRLGVPVPWAPSGRAALFLGLTMAIGPGLVVNVVLKDHSHRPRPAQVIGLGGDEAFRPWYRFDGACAENCSFASGEAAQGFWMVAPALLVPPPWRTLALVGAAAFGVGASELRLAYGGHFPSDVLVGALITLIVIELTRRAIWPKDGP